LQNLCPVCHSPSIWQSRIPLTRPGAKVAVAGMRDAVDALRASGDLPTTLVVGPYNRRSKAWSLNASTASQVSARA